MCKAIIGNVSGLFYQNWPGNGKAGNRKSLHEAGFSSRFGEALECVADGQSSVAIQEKSRSVGFDKWLKIDPK